MLGARQFMEGSSEMNSYVADGLICWYDGFDNAGPGMHNASAMTWKNLGSLGSAYDATRRAGVFQTNGAVFADYTNKDSIFIIPGYLLRDKMKGEWSVEVVFTPGSLWKQNFHGIFGGHIGKTPNNSKGLVFGQYEAGPIRFVLFRPLVVLWDAPASEFTVDTMCSMSISASNTARAATVWKDGVQKAAPTGVDVLLNNSDSRYTCIGSAYYDETLSTINDRAFHGKIHCVRVYDRPITAAEVATNNIVDKRRFGL